MVDQRHEDLVIPRIEYPELCPVWRVVRVRTDEHLESGVVLIEIDEVSHIGVQ